MSKTLEQYGLIGDGEAAALVGRDGSIDWLCWPRFDSDACLAALLGSEEHGRWLIAPAEPAQTTRRYREDTLILETEFSTSDGKLRVTDLMPTREGSPALIRVVTGLEGRVRLRMRLKLRFDYGQVAPWIELKGREAVAKVGPDLVVLEAPVPVREEGGEIAADFDVEAGDEMAFSLLHGSSHGSSAAPIPAPIDWAAAISRTEKFWQTWVSSFDKPTDWPQAVRRSLITLKALVHHPTGGVVAAPTTSLPEVAGGEKNWDYRYCWLRDATFTLAALLNAGFEREAKDWRDWLTRAVGETPDKLQILYRVDGGRRVPEWTADWLPGYRWAKPVRVGNAASAQFQLDVFGELMDVFHLAARAGIEASDHEVHLTAALARHVRQIWGEPDQGMWEERGQARHFVYSKVMAWVAVDRFLKLQPEALQEERQTFKDLQTRMHDEICREGYDKGLRTFTSFYGGQTIDASLLLMPLVGFLPVDDERVAETIARIERDLVFDGLVRRKKPNGSGTPEGAFLACTCWLADCQAMQGRHAEARRSFERVLSVANDLGLLSEEYDCAGRRLSGNFPQALSHIAVVNTALGLCGPVLSRGGG